MNNLNVFAEATITSGNYDNIKIFGSANVSGDVTCDNVKVFGSSEFKGKCKINSLKVYGSCEFEDFVEVKEMNIKGSCEFNNDVKVEYLKIYGSVDINKTIFRSKEVIVYGEVNVSNLEADLICVKGFVNCKETLNGEKIEISTNDGSKIKEMVGTNIVVKPARKFFFSLNKHDQVEVETIEGDDIYLENVFAKVVRGNKIKIGPNCKIETVEYSGTVDISDKSEVSNAEKI